MKEKGERKEKKKGFNTTRMSGQVGLDLRINFIPY